MQDRLPRSVSFGYSQDNADQQPTNKNYNKTNTLSQNGDLHCDKFYSYKNTNQTTYVGYG